MFLVNNFLLKSKEFSGNLDKVHSLVASIECHTMLADKNEAKGKVEKPQ